MFRILCLEGAGVANQDVYAILVDGHILSQVISEKYISRVHYQRPNSINAYSSGCSLFEYLENNWSFVPGPNPNSCYLDFRVKFKFRSHTYQELINYLFESLAEQMISSFEQRCKYMYNRTSSKHS